MTAARNQPIDARTISAPKKTETRIIYKKDPDHSASGFTTYDEAATIAEALRIKYVEPGHRVRTRFRSRTNTWDVVIKVRTEVKSEPAQAKAAA